MALTASTLLAAVLPVALAQGPPSSSGGAPPSGGGPPGGGAPSGGPPPSDEPYVPTQADFYNNDMIWYTVYAWVALVVAFFVHRWSIVLLRYVRRLANLGHGSGSDDKQRYFAVPSERYAWLKRNVIIAPFWRKRHNREFKLSAAMNVGTLPGRLQTMFLAGYLALNIVMVTYEIEWNNLQEFNKQASNRFGVIATLNIIPLFLLAGRNNPLILLLGLPFDTYNLIHRWIGRIVVFEALAHVVFWIFSKPAEMRAMILSKAIHHEFIYSGLIAMVCFGALLLQSPSIIRHAFYETFLHVHIILAIVACATLWIHLAGMPFQHMLLAAIIFWALERGYRFFTLLRRNVGNGGTKAEIEALPGDCVRVTLRIARPWKFRPGSHLYMYMPSVGLWTSHPFSIAWSDTEATYSNEKGLPMNRQDLFTSRKQTMSLIIRRRTGFTDRMFTKAESSPSARFITTAFVEGPYNEESFGSYGTVFLFAAGIGIAHQVPHVRDLVGSYAAGTAATRRVVLCWIIQSPEHLEWIRPWMTQILGMEKRREILKILLFVTRPRSTKEIHSPSASVQMFPGKPDVGALIEKEQEKQIGAMAVSVCGTGSLADDVRRACRDRMEKTEIDFYEEAFSW